MRDLLIVGAGPTGLFAALQAARAGLDLDIIDREWRIAARSYACVLHPQTLDLLEPFGVLERLLEFGVRIDRVAFFEGRDQRAEVRLDQLPVRNPFALALYQDDLEGLLEDRLREQFGRRVGWGRRLAALQWPGTGIRAVVEKLLHTPTGDSRRRWEEVVDTRTQIDARFILGADGSHSKMAHLLGLESAVSGEPHAFDIYEFEPLTMAGTEMRVALTGSTVNTLWPLPGGTCRWSLEASSPETPATPENPPAGNLPESRALSEPSAPAGPGRGGREHLQRRIQEVAPWFDAGVRELDWATRVDFPRRVAHQMGRGPCWLLGDAAHQTLPGGGQSMNSAFLEAEEWVAAARGILREGVPASSLTELGSRWQSRWQSLTGLMPSLETREAVSPWVAENAQRLVASLPAGGEALRLLLGQLGLGWK